MLNFNVLNRFTSAVQFTAEIDCTAYASQSIKLGLAVRWATKSGANLRGANLRGANLCDANLGDQWIVSGAVRSDGYPFFLQKLKDDKVPMVKAGCRYFTLDQAQAHWETIRKGHKLLIETEVIVRSMVSLARARGLMK